MGAIVREVKRSKKKANHWLYIFGILDHLKIIVIDFPESLIKIYHYTLRNSPEERSSRREICFLKIIRFE